MVLQIKSYAQQHAISELVTFNFAFNTSLHKNHSFENIFCLQVHILQINIFFNMKDFAKGLVLKQRHNLEMVYRLI